MREISDGKDFSSKLENSFKSSEDLSLGQRRAWEDSYTHVRKLFEEMQAIGLGEVSCVFEYFLPFSEERIDILLIGESGDKGPIAIVVELKGWSEVKITNKFTVWDGKRNRQHPDIQLQNYVKKLEFFHSASDKFKFDGFLWFYNMKTPIINLESVAFYSNEYKNIAQHIKSKIDAPTSEDNIKLLLDGKYVQTVKLLQTIKENLGKLEKDALEAFCSLGFAPSEEQAKIVSSIVESVKKDIKKCFFIQGSPGSGKTYLAILILLEVLKKLDISEREKVALAYRNNRLLNTVRYVFEKSHIGLGDLVKFYSTGKDRGLAEGDPTEPYFHVVIYDEAQRMKNSNINKAIQRGDITVFFYDEGQRLNLEEEGNTENFIKQAKDLGREYEKFTLNGTYRNRGGREYHLWIEDILSGKAKKPNFRNYDIKIFEDIEQMLSALKDRGKTGKVALVASFTESTGYGSDKLRVGYPLPSKFDHYKGKKVKIEWLMDAKSDYPEYWVGNLSNKLTHCSSIYGCQGLEADYVGVIWGRDFVWRENEWTVGDNCEDDVEKDKSLKKLFEKAKNGDETAKKDALELLTNRYRIFLTRGILGTYIYCEDEITKDYLLSIINSG